MRINQIISENTINTPQYLLHGSPNNNLTLNDIKLFNPNAKQNKNNKIYGGFYTTDQSDIAQAQKYATQSGSIYKIFINPNANIITKDGDITRLSQNTISQYLNNNIDIVKGKDPRGYTEYAIINTNIITNISKITNLTEATTTLNDLYDYHELNDESEDLYHWTNPDQFDTQYTVKIMFPDDIKRLKTSTGDISITQAFKQFASPEQKQLVKDKAKNFDHNRIIVIANNTIIDGNHHAIAAIVSDNPVNYIDIYEEE